jgi:hypothetical protein
MVSPAQSTRAASGGQFGNLWQNYVAPPLAIRSDYGGGCQSIPNQEGAARRERSPRVGAPRWPLWSDSTAGMYASKRGELASSSLSQAAASSGGELVLA